MLSSRCALEVWHVQGVSSGPSVVRGVFVNKLLIVDVLYLLNTCYLLNTAGAYHVTVIK